MERIVSKLINKANAKYVQLYGCFLARTRDTTLKLTYRAQVYT